MLIATIYVLLLGYIGWGLLVAFATLFLMKIEIDRGYRKPITYCEGLRLIIKILITWPFIKQRQHVHRS